tara:strand:+ start:370 stop:1482 length:1113 start_codon:yes stop_codon:yes gene_type:complete
MESTINRRINSLNLRRPIYAFLAAFALSLGAHPTAEKPHGPQEYVTPSHAVVLGEGENAFELIPGWASDSQSSYTFGSAHALAEDLAGNIYLANTSPDHCILVFSPVGELLKSWGNSCETAHGLQIVNEGDREVIFLADSNGHRIYKTTLDGEILMSLSFPAESGLYKSADTFKPSKTMHLPGGDFFVIDGYGSDYIHRYDTAGNYLYSFGGDLGEGEAQLQHWGPNGGAIDFTNPDDLTIILALSDQQKLKRFTLEGEYLETIPMPGSNPRDIVFHEDKIFIPHLGDDWPDDRTSPGIITVHNRHTFELLETLGGRSVSPQTLDSSGGHYRHEDHVFLHPHGILVSRDGDLYVAQFASNGTTPLKFKKR